MAPVKRYQVFVSSTFLDLRDERQVVLQALSESDYIPAGMELFPPADGSAWQTIQNVIDLTDYYILIIAGRYGSQDDEGRSYTEREYDMAVSSGRVVIPLLHENPTRLRHRDGTETERWKRLEKFRQRIKDNHPGCGYWNSTDKLVLRVLRGLTNAVKHNPTPGWVRADQVPSEADAQSALVIRRRVEELEAQLDRLRTTPPAGTEGLAGGEEVFDAHFTVTVMLDERHFDGSIQTTWNDIFGAAAPKLINEASDQSLKSALRDYFETLHRGSESGAVVGDDDWYRFREHELDTCIVQLRALGLIEQSVKKRGVRDTSTYWKLTPYGDGLMTRLRALKSSGAVIPGSVAGN